MGKKLEEINFDEMNLEQLKTAGKNTKLHARQRAYALKAARAQTFRLAGQKDRALLVERELEEIYAKLPVGAQW